MTNQDSTDDTRTKIVRAAARCLAQRGVRGLRMTDIGREAGVSSGLLYYHFADRDGLLAATLAHVNATAAAERGAVAPDARTALIDNLVDEIADEPEVREHAIAWQEITASAVFDETLAAHLADSTGQWQQRIANTLGRVAVSL